MQIMQRILGAVTIASVLMCATAIAVAQSRGGRYDDQIRADVAKLLASKSECKNVKAKVDDSVVTLTGTVELDSERRTIVTRVRRIPHVEEVDSQILLAPPAPLDDELYARITRRLRDAGFEQIKPQVHEGAVVLQGSVRTMRDRHAAVELAWSTEGVQEVESQLSVMQPDAR
jgi:osmotically-inducible protein OsmY